MAQAIVSYTGRIGTEYTSDANVDFWELEHCGNNECVICDASKVHSVDVGDFLLIKGTDYPGLARTGATCDVRRAWSTSPPRSATTPTAASLTGSSSKLTYQSPTFALPNDACTAHRNQAPAAPTLRMTYGRQLQR